VRLVNDDVFETKFLEYTFFDQADFVACDADFEVLRQEPVRDDFCTFLFGTREKGDVEVRTPLFELARPILQRGFWHNDKM